MEVSLWVIEPNSQYEMLSVPSTTADITVLPKDWICRCGLITEFFRDVCTCGQTKETGKVAIWRNMSDTVVQNWRCEKCDIVNGKLMGLCRKCGEARGDADLE
eukprot:CAMPEP_0201531726 /NCGR_PEP_ID=MMETSP0161_2-20130828/48461_1 /ASSEMBLY_ACC=CAM_ASM_000251 /TAXON_ID=180227 /ORGANISM="Neoparamoeba aestuarina, Strain SoJaBio B1-5/56/2" /LENGTH=102 /DNA_ID=CAMNT_0047934791 /DNA_START=482 /DNA_END=788 /DNA_ORIENTATION=+